MNTERKLLAAAMSGRPAFDAVDRYLDEADLTEPGRLVLDQIKAYYERDPEAKLVDIENLRGLVLQTVSNPKHKQTFETIMDALGDTEVSGINVVHELIGAKQEALGAKLSQALAAGDQEGVLDMMEEYTELSSATSLGEDEKESDLLNAPRISELMGDNAGEGHLIPMYPRSLNERLDGGLLRGHHVVIFARPEMGKTMFLCNLVGGFLAANLRVLYIGNEEPIEDTGLRMMGRITERTRYEVLADEAFTEQLADERGYQNLYMKRLTPGTPREIEALVREVQPDVLIIDQLRNVQMKEDNIVRQLEKAANAVRQIGGRHNCLVLSVTQAGDSASGKSVLDMGDVDSSNTGIPGACDVMIGIGASGEDEASGRRVLSLPKNKRSGRHDFFPVGVNPSIAKIVSMD
jgi:archaellum biogenesis ATPase FlaH